ncbi:hypothetical protein HME9304_01381 [Flagellimonas maritima]|uniref:Multidrug resistance protein MdtA-like barrel-sandwich hybrid domain-containing protein n=1 Tax=Flagellimonas maritima TaxID=1383885 RepID=A0A2Z4LR58_9FLAO|nr:efflux RND transporter periplasmic adaptor subunit [Allomuricauda aurantiaca]AWX44381.1 hypothetical protein HME9304_01381 [Allomuricauda aurantiaca]
MKKTIGIAIGIGILVLGVLLFVLMKKGPKKQEAKAETDPKSVSVETQAVELRSLPYRLEATGTLEAKEKIELFSEVQGVLNRTNTPFKEGNSFTKGQTILYIDANEFKAQLKANKSSLVNQIAAMLPDMEMEYPEAAEKWEEYLISFDIEGNLEALPAFQSEAERLFVIGKNITQTYYNTSNLQERLFKYYIRAPFTGVVSEANVNAGALVRSGQKLGSFVDPSVFELRLSVPASENDFLNKGQKVLLKTLGSETELTGKVERINPIIDQNTQTIEIFVEVTGNNLKDGQYLKALIAGKEIEEVFTISSDLLTVNGSVYVVKDGVLSLQEVTPVNYVGDSVVVRGLKDGQSLITKSLANAYPGMPVTQEER